MDNTVKEGRQEGLGIVTNEQYEVHKVTRWKVVNFRIVLKLEISISFTQVYVPSENSAVKEVEKFDAEL